jgi:hypothetical protein
MTRCNIQTFMTSIGGVGPDRARSQCSTHMMPDIVSIEGLCPIGRIEDATEKALAKIAEAERMAPPGITPP